MAKKIEIRTASYVHVGDKLVCTDDLTQDQKCKLATELKVEWMNALFRGQAEFYAAGEKNEKQRRIGDDLLVSAK